MKIRIKLKYVKELGKQLFNGIADISKIRLLEQKGPTCWLYAVMNNFQLQTGIGINRRKAKSFLAFCRAKGAKTDKGGPVMFAVAWFVERWNDHLKSDIKIKAYYINNLLNKDELKKFTRLTSMGNKFIYSRNAGKGFTKDRKDLVLDQTDWEDSNTWHAVNLGKDEKNKRGIEYGSYGSRYKYNILGFLFTAFRGLLKGKDLRPSVYLIVTDEMKTKRVIKPVKKEEKTWLMDIIQKPTKKVSRKKRRKDGKAIYVEYINKPKYIVLHHTGVVGRGNERLLSTGAGRYSCHYLIKQDGTVYQFAKDTQVTWHAGTGYYKGIRNQMNHHSIGIEVESNGKDFTEIQRTNTRLLINKIMKEHEGMEIIRHKDYAPKRKWDIGDNFWKIPYKSFKEYAASYK